MTRDLLYALRSIRRQPAFFAIAVATLALGIGSTTAIFTLFHQVLLRTLPVAAPQELVVLHQEGFDIPGGVSKDNFEAVFSYPMYVRLRDGLAGWRGVAARTGTGGQVVIDGVPAQVRAEIVSGNFFSTLGIQPAYGRLLAPSDDVTRGGHPVAVISHGFFLSRFGGKAEAVGKKIVFAGQPFEIAGVTPAAFRGLITGNSPDLFIPLAMRGAITPGWNNFDRPTSRWLNILGRLPGGAQAGDVKVALQTLFTNVAREHAAPLRMPETARARAVAATIDALPAASGLNTLARQWSEPLWVLFAMVLVLLLVACANLANLLLARGVNRAKEIAIRVSMGASRVQVVKLLLTETLVVSVLGAALGAGAAPLLANAIIRTISDDGAGGWITGAVNAPMLGFAVVLAMVATLAAGVAPAWKISRGNNELATRSPLHARSRKFFIATQIAMSLVLLAVAGLFGKSLLRLMEFRPGFVASQLSMFTINPGSAGYDPARGAALLRDTRARLAALGGVTAVSAADTGPLSGSTSSSNVEVEGYRHPDDENMDVNVMAVGPAYAAAMGTRLVAGRDISERDTMESPRVALVNQAFVKRFLKDPNAPIVGRHMSQGSGGPLDIEIVGVVEDSKHQNLREAVDPAVFVSMEQHWRGQPRAGRLTFYVRSSRDVMGEFRKVAAQADAHLPVTNVQTMITVVENTISTDRLLARLATAFGLLALLITAMGLYGVLSYLTRRRTAEIGIRMALGATRGNILAMIGREVVLLIGAGVAVGLAGAFLAGRAVESQLFGVKGLDGIVLAGAIGVLLAVAAMAAAVPSARAASVQPVEALRHE
ncbi:MAG: ABC transporter permease [Acidobacteria bacterium]|nr:ABC transporter permease [Acidobacteriota bacterium]